MMIIVSIYWSLIASDRYVSESNIVLESPQISAPSLNFSSLLRGGSGSGDMLLLRDYLLSVDMLKLLDEEAEFRKHYADTRVDFFTRLVAPDVTIEELHEYFLDRISVELDEYSQVLRVKVQAFSPEKAHQISKILLKDGERHMNLMGQRLAEEQVRFLELQVSGLADTFEMARKELINFQNKNGLISATGTVENINVIVGGLERQLAELRAVRSALITYQSVNSPEIVKTDNQIQALLDQINSEQARMATESGNALNSLSSDYLILELKVRFAQESYSGALAALESTRIESARKLKQVSILQNPTLPEYSQQPERIHNIAVFSLVTIFIALIIQMLLLIIRDHRD